MITSWLKMNKNTEINIHYNFGEFKLCLIYHTILTFCLYAFRIIANMVVATADNRSVLSSNGDVNVPEWSLICSATVFITERRHPIILDGAVDCDVAESSRQVGVHCWHPDHRSGNTVCNNQADDFRLKASDHLALSGGN